MPSSNDAGAETRTGLRFGPMHVRDLEDVVRIEDASFPSPWKREHFLHELRHNRFAVNRVLRRGRHVIGYASVWIINRELQVNKIAVDPAERGSGLGRKLLERLLALADETRCLGVKLEVRPINEAARSLYAAFGFKETGRRDDYYGPGEPGIVMRLDRDPPLSARPAAGILGADPQRAKKGPRMTTAGEHVRDDPGFRRLQDKHGDYDRRLSELRAQRYLSDEEKLEEVRLKKMKLALKDQMETMLDSDSR